MKQSPLGSLVVSSNTSAATNCSFSICMTSPTCFYETESSGFTCGQQQNIRCHELVILHSYDITHLHLCPLLFHQSSISQCFRPSIIHLWVTHMTLLQGYNMESITLKVQKLADTLGKQCLVDDISNLEKFLVLIRLWQISWFSLPSKILENEKPENNDWGHATNK